MDFFVFSSETAAAMLVATPMLFLWTNSVVKAALEVCGGIDLSACKWDGLPADSDGNLQCLNRCCEVLRKPLHSATCQFIISSLQRVISQAPTLKILLPFLRVECNRLEIDLTKLNTCVLAHNSFALCACSLFDCVLWKINFFYVPSKWWWVIQLQFMHVLLLQVITVDKEYIYLSLYIYDFALYLGSIGWDGIEKVTDF